ncbi:MAG: type III-A CRISPR-associated protein Csm2 [Alistipes sp.]|nr:type III-A CRISPR-associated protein Csm2 [Alistipes sp.]
MNVTEINRRFNPNWITTAIDEDCITLCEDLAKSMINSKISSSFLRNIFGELRRIEAGGFEKHRAEFVLLRPKLAYTCGRASSRNNKADDDLQALQELYKKSAQLVTDAKGFKNVVNIMEAIIAFHKANGGKE